MFTENFDIAIIPISLGISGLVFLGIAFFLKHKYSYRGGVKSVGILIGFRKLDNDHYYGAMRTALGCGAYKDYHYNVPNSKPILRFRADGQDIECHSEWPANDLGKGDIGRNFPIRYFSDGRGGYRVVLDAKHYDQQRSRGEKIIFWIFAGIGFALFLVAILAIITFG